MVRTLGLNGAIDTALSPDGKRLAVASFWRDGAVFDLETGGEAFELKGTIGSVVLVHGGVSWSPDGRNIAATTADGASVWDARTGRLRFTLVGHGGFVLSAAWSPDSSRLVTGGVDGTAKVWEIGMGGVRELWSLSAQETTDGIVGVVFSPDGARVMAGDAGITAVKIWDLGPNGDAEWANLPAAGAPAEFMPDGRRLVATSGSSDCLSALAGDYLEWDCIGDSLQVWDLQTERVLRTIGPLPFYLSFRLGESFGSFDVSPDGGSIAAGGSALVGFGGEVVGVWDAATGEDLFTISHPLDVTDVAFSLDGEHLVTAGWDGAARIFDRAGRVIRVLHDEGYELLAARFSPDGRLVATAARIDVGQYRLRIWDWERGEIVRTISADAWSLDFDPSGSRIATAGRGGQAEIWDVESGTRLALLAGNSGGVNDVAFSPDGSHVATAGLDGTVRLFEADTGAQQLVLRGHRCGVYSVAFSPDGTKLASASACDGVRIWALDIDDLLEIARQQVTRSLTDEECRQYLHVDRCSQA